MIKISETMKKQMIEFTSCMVGYVIVAGVGAYLNIKHANNKIDNNDKIVNLEREIIELKKSRIKCEIEELQNK